MPSGEAGEYIVKQPIPGAVKRVGTAVMKGTTRRGKLTYYLHWDPAAIQGSCEIHTDCYATWPLMSSPEEGDIVNWIAGGPSFKDASDHMKTLPPGWYHHRPRR